MILLQRKSSGVSLLKPLESKACTKAHKTLHHLSSLRLPHFISVPPCTPSPVSPGHRNSPPSPRGSSRAPCCPGWVSCSLPAAVGSALHQGLCVILPETPTSATLPIPLLKELSQVSTGKQKSLKHLKQEGFNAGNSFPEWWLRSRKRQRSDPGARNTGSR